MVAQVFVVVVLFLDLYTIPEHIRGLGFVQDLVELLMILVEQMKIDVGTLW